MKEQKLREIEDKTIINQVQKDYPENSEQALRFAITLTRIRERDNCIIKLRKARLDERIRAEQDFLKMIDEQIKLLKKDIKGMGDWEEEWRLGAYAITQCEELKSTIQKQETKE
jgi:hypothetical protein